MTHSTYFLGIDGGGTRCRARLQAGDGTPLGDGLGGPANIRLGLERAWTSILTAIDAALAQAGLDRGIFPLTHLGLGLAGVTTSEDGARVRMSGPRFASVQVETDAHVACLGAFSGADGAILIAGTGSVGYALIGGMGRGVGGWGFEVSDEGSGAAVGREAIRAALRGHDGIGPETPFTRQVLGQLGGTPAAVVEWVGRAQPADYGRLAPDALTHAGQGDVVAIAILKEAAAELERYIRRLHGLGAPRICLMGGLAAPLMRWLSPWAQSLLADPEGDALQGALLLARQAASLPTTQSPLPISSQQGAIR